MITLTNIFFLVPTTQLADNSMSGGKMIFKSSGNDAASVDGIVYLVKRPDRSIIQSNKYLVEMVRAAVALFIVLFFVPSIFKINFNSYRLKQLLSSNSPSAHLIFCTFRI
jgi:hypothetical protein